MLVTLFDTETTGLVENSARRIEKQPRIIELFALTLQQSGSGPDAIFTEVDTWHSLFNPECIIPSEVIKITGITDEMVKAAPKFNELADEVMSYMARAHRVVAHNISYDCDMVDYELTRIEKSIVWPEKLCTVEQTEFIKGHRLSLGKNKNGQDGLYEYLFGESFPNAHRAESDVRPNARCYIELVRRNWI